MLIKKLPAYQYALFILVMLGLAACKTPYQPTIVTSVNNYLVVEGMINTGADSSYIKLSRTLNLISAAKTKPELKAKVSIESDKGSTYALTDMGAGTYACAPLNLSSANQYHVKIITSDGRTYLSDFTAPKAAPAIDSVSWKAGSNGLGIYVTSHDANSATHYYRWDYTEEWEFHSNYFSSYISNGTNIGIRDQVNNQIYRCYTGDVSTNIVLASTTALSSDVASNVLVNLIPPDAEKISAKYSILVKQYALTADAYNFWTQLKKNTEQLGSIFDSQPSATIGNIHCTTNAAEPVIGYISAGTFTTKRIFIAKSQLPNWITTPFYPGCESDTLRIRSRPKPNSDPTTDQFVNFKSKTFISPASLQIPLDSINAAGIPAYISAAAICVDCTLRGSSKPPSYWK